MAWLFPPLPSQNLRPQRMAPSVRFSQRFSFMPHFSQLHPDGGIFFPVVNCSKLSANLKTLQSFTRDPLSINCSCTNNTHGCWSKLHIVTISIAPVHKTQGNNRWCIKPHKSKINQ